MLRQLREPRTLFREFVDDLIASDTSTKLSVATLGPSGTSSEEAARHFIQMLEEDGIGRSGEVLLYPSFEAAADAVLTREATVVLAPNAYSNVSQMYMNPRLTLAGAFILPTPLYGIAAARGKPIPLVVRIVTHPAPLPLVAELLPPAFLAKETIFASSTSEAARKVIVGEAELALTNEPSANQFQLKFISRTRPIEMLWSVFVLAGGALPK